MSAQAFKPSTWNWTLILWLSAGWVLYTWYQNTHAARDGAPDPDRVPLETGHRYLGDGVYVNTYD
jgi:hypothetical protein